MDKKLAYITEDFGKMPRTTRKPLQGNGMADISKSGPTLFIHFGNEQKMWGVFAVDFSYMLHHRI